MPETDFRGVLVIIVGVIWGIALVISAARSKKALSLDRIARAVLGVSLMLLALFLLAGRTLWAGIGDVAPSWTAPAGITLLAVCLASGAVAGGFWVLRRVRVG